MAKTKISQYDATAANNTDIDSISIAEGMLPSNVNNALRELMAHLKDMDAGTQALTSPQLTSVDINGGTIDGAVIGGNSAAAVTGTTITGTSFVSTGDMTFADNDKAIFGAGSDLQIYHDGSNSFISDQGTGHIKILANDFRVVNAGNTEQMITADQNGAVTIYHDSAAKLATTSTGIDVTGTVTTDGLTAIVAGSTGDLATFGLSGNTNNPSLIVKGDATNQILTFRGGSNSSTYPAIAFDTGTGGEKLRIDSSGSVGIGVVPPSGSQVGLYLNGGGATYSTASTYRYDMVNSYFDGAWKYIGNGVATQIYQANGSFVFNQASSNSSGAGASLSWSEAMRIDSSGNVGIGTSAPLRQLHISNASANSEIAFTSGTSGVASLLFGDGLTGTDVYRGYLQYNHTDDAMLFATSANERMRIGSGGQLTSSVAGGVFETRADGGGFHYKQLLDVATAGCLITGQSNRGDLASISLYQTAQGADGGYIKFNTSNSGSTTPTEKVRIESSGLVNIGESVESGSAGVAGKNLNVVGGLSTAYDATNAATWTGIQTGNSTNSSNNTATGLTFFHRTSSSGIAAIQSTSSAADRADLRFITRGSAGISEKLLIASDGQFGFNTTAPSYKYDFYHDSSSTYMARFHHNGNNANRYGIVISVGTDNNSGTNVHMLFSDGDNTGVGSISSSSGTTSYNAFSASHEVILPDADNAEGYPYGTLVETSSITYAQNSSGQDFERGIRYNVTKSSGANSKAVLGAYSGKITHETNLHFAYILGDGHILCNNSGGNIAVGDGICTSSTAGIGQKATVNPSMIIGIAQEAITFDNNTEIKLVAVQYGLQQFTPWP